MAMCQLRFKDRYFHQLDLWLLHRKAFTLEESHIYYYVKDWGYIVYEKKKKKNTDFCDNMPQ